MIELVLSEGKKTGRGLHGCGLTPELLTLSPQLPPFCSAGLDNCPHNDSVRHVHRHTHTYTCTHTHTHTYMQALTHTHIHTLTYHPQLTFTCSAVLNPHKQWKDYARIHACTHTYTHTYQADIQLLCCLESTQKWYNNAHQHVHTHASTHAPLHTPSTWTSNCTQCNDHAYWHTSHTHTHTHTHKCSLTVRMTNHSSTE